MKPPKRKRVSETFEAFVVRDYEKCVRLPLKTKCVTGDRVRVKVTKLERGK